MPAESFTIGQRCIIKAGVLEGLTGAIAALHPENRVVLELDQAKGVSVLIAAESVRVVELQSKLGKQHASLNRTE